MSISVPCPRCEYTIRAVDAAAGTTILCPSCRRPVAVPAPEPADAPEPDAGGEWDGEEEPRPAKRPRRSALPLAVGGGLAVAAIVGGIFFSGAFTGGKPPVRFNAGPPPQQLALPEVRVEPAGDNSDPFRPTERTAADAVAALDALAAQSPAIPQDATRTAALRAARLEWSRKTTDEAFDRVGRADAPWAKQARDALTLVAKELARHTEFAAPLPLSDAATAALSEAVRAGCDDPLVLYFHSNTLFGDGSNPVPVSDARRIARQVWDSKYSDVRKAYAANNLLVVLRVRGAPADEIDTWDERFWEALGRAARDPDGITQDYVIDLARQREELAILSRGSRELAHNEFAAALKRAAAPEYTQKVVRGAFLIGHAWHARGGGTIDTVTANGARLFAERLAAAESELTAAYELDPNRPQAPTRMLPVCMGRGHPRPEMEKWFARAMHADPDNFQACQAKLEYLHPKWSGSPEEHVGFAWQCARTRNAVGMLPYAAVANMTGNAPVFEPMPPEMLEQAQKYYAEHRVWQVLHAALTTLRRDRADLRWLRAEHVRLACVAGRHDTAAQALAGVEDDHRAAGFASAATLNYYREWAKTGRPPAP